MYSLFFLNGALVYTPSVPICKHHFSLIKGCLHIGTRKYLFDHSLLGKKINIYHNQIILANKIKNI